MGAGGLGGETETPDCEVFEIGALAADGVDLGGADLVDDEAKAGAGLDGLELVEITDEEDLRTGAFDDVEDGSHLADGQRAGLVDDEDGVAVEDRLSRVNLREQAGETVGLRGAFVGEIDGGVPGECGRDDAVIALAVEVGDGTERDGLSGSGRAEAHGDGGVATGEVVDGVALLFADEVALSGELVEAVLNGLGRNGVTGGILGPGGRFANGALLGSVVEGRVEPGVREPGPGVGEASLAVFVKHDDRPISQNAGEHGAKTLGVDDAGGFAGDVFHQCGNVEHRFVDGQLSRKVAAAVERVADLRFGGWGGRCGKQRPDELLGVDVEGGFLSESGVALDGVGGVFAGAGGQGELLGEIGAVGDVDVELVGEALDALATGRPRLDEVFGDTGDPHEFVVVAVALHLQVEPFLEVPGKGVAVDGAAGADPLVGRALVVAAPLAIVVGAHEIEDDAVGVELRIVVAAGVVGEGDAEDVAGENLLAALAAAGVGAVLLRDGFERPSNRVVVTGFDLGAQFRIGDRPKGADGFVRAEREVESWGSVLERGAFGERCQIVGGQSGVEGLERFGVDVGTVFEAEQSGGVPPPTIGLVAAVVVVEGRSVARAVAEIVRGAGGLGERFHAGSRRLAKATRSGCAISSAERPGGAAEGWWPRDHHRKDATRSDLR